MAVKLNVNRKYWETVELMDDDGNKGQIEVQFRVPTVKDKDDVKVLDLITDIKGLDLHDDGKPLSLDETREVIAVDDNISLPIVKAYNEGKRRRLGLGKTSLK
ncbi:hypothetical protein [Thiomicrorhabdus indica]|uniref:hypothetical protein n=1 Tax=Thiomicrorhabdus indica TaxID=2267253 RepID=UPI002AA6CDE6|nr:hypothetical protein [Thiomicrorhabdus indica]